MKAVIWTDVIQASIMFIGLILSIIFGISFFFQNNDFKKKKTYKKGLIDIGGISKAFEIVKNGNRIQLSVYINKI